MSDLIAARYDEVSASEFEDDMVVIVGDAANLLI